MSQAKITISDAIMGSGKSLNIKNLISNSNVTIDKYLVITPFLGELHRIAQTTPRPIKKGESKKLLGKTPPLRDRKKSIIYNSPEYDKESCIKNFRFKQPEVRNASGSKKDSLLYLLDNKENIVSTHQLYQTFDKDSFKNCKNYTLIIDEAISVYETYRELSAKVVREQITLGNMYLDKDGITIRLSSLFNTDGIGNVTDHTFNIKDYKNLCDDGNLLLLHNSVVMWKLPKELFSSFKEVIICTYQFRGSILEAFLRQNNFKYEIKCWGKKPSSIAHLINIYDGNLNQNTDDTMFNYGWYGNYKNIDYAKKTLNNYFKSANPCSSKDRIWSCYGTTLIDNKTIEDVDILVGTAQFKTQWLAYNTKATNNYGDRHNIAYMVNIHYKPAIKDLIYKIYTKLETESDKQYKNRIKLQEELYAINEMIQFIWRSAIRNGETVNVFIPSKRMRILLQKWLKDEYESYRTALSVQHTQ